jgi:hypothetical protein
MTLFADVSEFNSPVDDSYPYQILSIRVSDGTYQDHNFAHNYRWMSAALDSGKLVCGIVYIYCEPSASDSFNTLSGMVNANGGLHPKVVFMLDIEWDNNLNPFNTDLSPQITPLYNSLVQYTKDPRRVIAYSTSSWMGSGIWRQSPPNMNWIMANYGANPPLPIAGTKLAHQYTNGTGYGAQSGLPDSCPPFGPCDMNSADGYTPEEFANVCGVATTNRPTVADTDLIWAQFSA